MEEECVGILLRGMDRAEGLGKALFKDRPVRRLCDFQRDECLGNEVNKMGAGSWTDPVHLHMGLGSQCSPVHLL